VTVSGSNSKLVKQSPLILHLGMLKSASTFLQRNYWNRFEFNVGKPLDNKTADLQVRHQIIQQELNTTPAGGLVVLSDEALLTGGDEHENYRKAILEGLGPYSVLPVVVCRRPTNLVSSAIAYFSKGTLRPNFKQTASDLFVRFPRLLEFLDYNNLRGWLQEEFEIEPLLVNIRELDTLPALLEAKFGEQAAVMGAGQRLSDLERVNESSPLRRAIANNYASPLYLLCPEWKILEELDSQFDSMFRGR
jgi:hypothetical protein